MYQCTKSHSVFHWTPGPRLLPTIERLSFAEGHHGPVVPFHTHSLVQKDRKEGKQALAASYERR